MRIDEGGYDRLAGQIDARRAGRRLHVALAADPDEPAALHEERGAFNRRATVAFAAASRSLSVPGLGHSEVIALLTEEPAFLTADLSASPRDDN